MPIAAHLTRPRNQRSMKVGGKQTSINQLVVHRAGRPASTRSGCSPLSTSGMGACAQVISREGYDI